MAMIKGVIFDFNGTLFWDTMLHNQAWDIFLELHGIVLSDSEKHETLHGKTNREILKNLFVGLSIPESDKLALDKETIYQGLCLRAEMQLAPGAQDFINMLIVHRVPYTIATASGKENVDFFFENYNLSEYFNRSKVVFNDGTIKSKPDPEIFQRAMAVLGIKASETLIFEDSVTGITAAENAAVAKIIIVNSNDEDYSKWPYQVIQHFNEVDYRIFDF